MLDVDFVVYVEDVADDGANCVVSGTREFADVSITAHTSSASSTSPAPPAASISGCWSCQLPSSSPLTAGMLGRSCDRFCRGIVLLTWEVDSFLVRDV